MPRSRGLFVSLFRCPDSGPEELGMVVVRIWPLRLINGAFAIGLESPNVLDTDALDVINSRERFFHLIGAAFRIADDH